MTKIPEIKKASEKKVKTLSSDQKKEFLNIKYCDCGLVHLNLKDWKCWAINRDKSNG